jgi:COMPASS component SWD3
MKLKESIDQARSFLVKFSPSKEFMAIVNSDAVVVYRNLVHYKTLISTCTDLFWSFDSSLLLTVQEDALELLNQYRFAQAYTHPGVFTACFNHRGNLIASGALDGGVHLFSTTSAKLIRTLPAHSEVVSAVQFSNDDSLLLTSSLDGLIRIWDTLGQCLKTLVRDVNDPVSACCFSPNSKYILASSLDSKIRVWDFISGRICKTYSGHTNKEFCLNALFYDDFIVAGSEDGRILIWNIQTRQVVHEWQAHKGCLLIRPGV